MGEVAMVMKRVARWSALVVYMVFLSGCASYYSHYGSFSAENSAGELREYLVSWQTADYPDWWWQEDESTPVTLKTQCSEREIRFLDASHQGSCSGETEAIAWCGTKNVDLAADVTEDGANALPCGWIAGDAKRITELGSELQLVMRCRPAQTTVGVGDDRKNVDYLKASAVPYWVSVKKVSRGSLQDRPPQLGTKICKGDS